MSRWAAVFAFTAHGLARELHQNNTRKRKALQWSQRAYHQPIASEPVRRFGRGHASGATPVRNLNLAESATLCDPGFQPRRSSLDRPQFCPTFGVHLSLLHQALQVLTIATQPLVGTLEYGDSVGQMEGLKNAAMPQWAPFIQSEKCAARRDSSRLKLGHCWLILDYYRYVVHAASESRRNVA